MREQWCLAFVVSFLEPMKFQVVEIEFDFDEDCTPGYKEDLVCDTLTTVWDADDSDDLVEEITCATGWCITSIDYRHVLV